MSKTTKWLTFVVIFAIGAAALASITLQPQKPSPLTKQSVAKPDETRRKTADASTLQPWPFTAPQIEIACHRSSDPDVLGLAVTVIEGDETEWALNSTARSLWPLARYPVLSSRDADTSGAIRFGMALCGRGTPPKVSADERNQ